MKGLFAKSMKPKTQVAFIKTLCGLFILLSVLIALNPNNLISTLMSLSWGALAGAFLGPFLYGLFWKGVTKAAVYASFVTGIGIVLFNTFSPFTTPPNAGAVSMLVSLAVVPAVSAFTKKLPEEHIKATFACYDEKVTAAHKFALNEVSEKLKKKN
jgi:SSS family solute:Na+ symporter